MLHGFLDFSLTMFNNRVWRINNDVVDLQRVSEPIHETLNGDLKPCRFLRGIAQAHMVRFFSFYRYDPTNLDRPQHCAKRYGLERSPRCSCALLYGQTDIRRFIGQRCVCPPDDEDFPYILWKMRQGYRGRDKARILCQRRQRATGFENQDNKAALRSS